LDKVVGRRKVALARGNNVQKKRGEKANGIQRTGGGEGWLGLDQIKRSRNSEKNPPEDCITLFELNANAKEKRRATAQSPEGMEPEANVPLPRLAQKKNLFRGR